MRPWLQGRFSEAEQEFAQMSAVVPISPGMPTAPSYAPVLLLWRAEFEIERARFGPAAALIREAQRAGTTDTLSFPDSYLARLYLSVGRFAEAKKLAMGQLRWDGRDIAKLKAVSAMDLVTVGEIALHRGDTGMAISILEKGKTGPGKTGRGENGKTGQPELRDFSAAGVFRRRPTKLPNASGQVIAGQANRPLSSSEIRFGRKAAPANCVIVAVGCPIPSFARAISPKSIAPATPIW
jgi:hypothetical protein